MFNIQCKPQTKGMYYINEKMKDRKLEISPPLSSPTLTRSPLFLLREDLCLPLPQSHFTAIGYGVYTG